MKILITTDLYAVNTNGVVTSVRNLTNALAARGHDVRILTLSESARSHTEGNVSYIRSMPLGIYPDVRMPLTCRHHLIDELIEWRPDIIHSQCEFFSYQFALRIARRTGAPIVHTYHTLYEQYAAYVVPSRRIGDNGVRLLTRLRLRRAAALIAPTQKVEEALRSYGIEGNISIIPSGINLTQHQRRLTASERLDKRRALGIRDDAVALINLGRLGAEKNLGELIGFFAEAARRDDRLIFLIVGDGPARVSLESLAKELGVSEKVIFTGMIRPEEVHAFYQLGDLFVSASTSETQGLTYIEAAANGLPLLCRRDKCLDGVLLPGENGFDFTDSSGFLAGLHALADDAQARALAGKKSEAIAARFSIPAFADAVEQVYRSLISQAARPSDQLTRSPSPGSGHTGR